jgi:CelD/BcsL family acetyltransferase involved in cellulose biosynthesis
MLECRTIAQFPDLSIGVATLPMPPATEIGLAGVNFRCLAGSEVFFSNKEPWSDLLSGHDRLVTLPTFFGSPNWLQSWSKQLGKAAQYFTFVAEKDGRWMGVLPLMTAKLKRGHLQIKALTLASWPELDNFEIPALDQGIRQALLDFALDYSSKNIRGWKIFQMREISKNGPTHLALQDYCSRHRIALTQEIRALTPVLDLREYHAREEKQSRQEAHRIAKLHRRIARVGRVSFTFETADADHFQPILQDCIEVERRSWKAQALDTAALLISPTRSGFALELCRNLANSNQLAIGILRLDGRAIATDWGILDQKRYLSYHTSFDQAHKSLGLGPVLLDQMIEAAPDLGIEMFDGSRGSTDGMHILHHYSCPYREQMLTTFYRPGMAGTALRLTLESMRSRRGLDQG